MRGETATEAPAARVLSIAYDALEREALGHDLASLKRRLADVYASTLVEGRWFSDLREAIDAFTKVTRARVSGTVELRLSGGECTVVSCHPAAFATAAGTDSSRAVA